MFVGPIRFRPGIVEVRPAVMALFVGSGKAVQRGLGDRSLHRPFKRIDGADDQHGRLAVPAHIAQRLLPILGAQRLECPGRVGAEFGGHAQFAQNFPRFFIARNHE